MYDPSAEQLCGDSPVEVRRLFTGLSRSSPRSNRRVVTSAKISYEPNYDIQWLTHFVTHRFTVSPTTRVRLNWQQTAACYNGKGLLELDPLIGGQIRSHWCRDQDSSESEL